MIDEKKLIEYIDLGHLRNHEEKVFSENDVVNMINAQPKVGQWIPVEERLPENDYGKHWKDRARYNVVVNGVVATATFGYKDENWWVDNEGYVFDEKHYRKVTHWQPAPEPCRPQEEGVKDE